MNIAFAIRPDIFSKRGGDTTQMLLTKKYLESMYNVHIQICLHPDEISSTSWDIVHIFNIQTYRQSIDFIRAAKQIKAKVVLSPIYWNLKYSMFYIGLSTMKVYKPRQFYPLLVNPCIKLYHFIAHDSYLSAGYKKNIRFMLENSDIILPNSDEEWEIMKDHFNVMDKLKMTPIPNAIEISPVSFEYPSGIIKNKIIHVGSISPTKNQLGTLLALFHRPELSICFVGRVQDHAYYQYLLHKASKRGNVFFRDEMTREDLMEQYKTSAVHVLPSFRESPGLVSLEAFYYGCEIVVSDVRFTPVHYYRFGDIAHICNPFDIHSISAAITHALDHPKQARVNKDDYFSFFNYSTVARMTYEAYQSVL